MRLYYRQLTARMDFPPSRFVKIENNTISVNASSRAEGKLALMELRLKKKELGVQKRLLSAEQKLIRAGYTEEVRTRGSMLRGAGAIGRIFRVFQSNSRDNRRVKLASDLAPLERQKQDVEKWILLVERVILQVESQMLSFSA